MECVDYPCKEIAEYQIKYVNKANQLRDNVNAVQE